MNKANIFVFALPQALFNWGLWHYDYVYDNNFFSRILFAFTIYPLRNR